TEEELKKLWRLGRALEEHYMYPQDFEWTIERGGEVFLVQTRAVTFLAKERVEQAVEEPPIAKGLGASPGCGTGPVKLLLGMKDLGRVSKGDILVTKMTTRDYVPSMVKTAGKITDEGGMTSHAAIVSRELGVPCVVRTSDATKLLKEGMVVTVDGSGGNVFKGRVTVGTPSRSTTEEVEE